MPRKFEHRKCEQCEKRYRPKGPRQKYCKPDCADLPAVPKRKAKTKTTKKAMPKREAPKPPRVNAKKTAKKMTIGRKGVPSVTIPFEPRRTTWWDRLLKLMTWDGKINKAAATAPLTMREANGGSVAFPFTNPDVGTEFDDRFFVNISRAGPLDLPPQTLQAIQRLSIILYRKNVRAFNAIELVKDFVLGDGVGFEAEDDNVQKMLDLHWEINEWEDRIEDRIRTLALTAHQIYPAFTREDDGLVTLSSLNPLLIRNVIRDPENAEELIQVITARDSFEASTIFDVGAISAGKVDEWDIIRMGREGKLVDGKDGINPAFFFKINSLSGATLGTPDLSASLDWLEGLDGFLFSTLERGHAAQSIVFDLEIEGAEESDIDRFVTEFERRLRDGGIHGHNEKIKLNIKTPNLGSFEAEATAKMIQKQINAGLRLPAMFQSDSEDLTRAAAGELTVPVARYIQGRQNFIKRMLNKIFRYQIQQSKAAPNGIPADANESFRIIMDRVDIRDIKQMADGLASLASSLDIAQQAGWVSPDQAAKAYGLVLSSVTARKESERSSHEEMTPEESDLIPLLRRIQARDGNSRTDQPAPAGTAGAAN